jgi:autophagy-related protein 2
MLKSYQAKILPLRLYVDQDAVDFLKKFFSFKDPEALQAPNTPSNDGDIYFREHVFCHFSNMIYVSWH